MNIYRSVSEYKQLIPSLIPSVGTVRISETVGRYNPHGVESVTLDKKGWREGETSVAVLYPDYGWPPCAFREERVIWQPFARARSRERVRIWNYVLVYSSASVIMRTVMTPRATTRAVKLHFQFMKRQLYGAGGGRGMTEHGPSQRHPAKRARKSIPLLSPPPLFDHVFRNNEVV